MRRANDYYPTPSWCVRALLETVDLPSGRWLEPTAGDGAIIREVNRIRQDITWDAIEIDGVHVDDLIATQASVIVSDVLDYLISDEYQIVIGNPPYRLTETILDHILGQVSCPVVMLLPLQFLASQRREGFFARHGIPDVLVMPRRPSFLGGGTAAVESTWMIWQSKAARGLLPGRIDRIPLEVCHD